AEDGGRESGSTETNGGAQWDSGRPDIGIDATDVNTDEAASEEAASLDTGLGLRADVKTETDVLTRPLDAASEGPRFAADLGVDAGRDATIINGPSGIYLVATFDAPDDASLQVQFGTDCAGIPSQLIQSQLAPCLQITPTPPVLGPAEICFPNPTQ